MVLRIHLLGAPRVVTGDGATAPAPRGTKAWALLAYLLLRGGPAPRAEVAELLFPQAVDRAAALRWNLTVLRRLVGDREAWRGDPLTWAPAVPPVVDVLVLHADPDRLPEAVLDPAPENDLLAGLVFAVLPAFDLWLRGQRRRARGAAEAWLHEAALVRLAQDDADGAAALAARLVAADPSAEEHRALARVVAAVRPGGGGSVRHPTAEDTEVEEARGLHATLARTPSGSGAAAAMHGLARAAAMRAHYGRAEHWLDRASAATDDPDHTVGVLVLRGVTRTDVADYPAALQALDRAGWIDRTVRTDPTGRRRAEVCSLTGRVHLLRGDLDSAADAFDEALRWTPAAWELMPGTEALRAEVDRLRGRTADALARLDRARATAVRAGSRGTEMLAARGLGLVQAAQGNPTAAVTTLRDAVHRSGRGPGRWLWSQLWTLEALAGIGARHRLGGAAGWSAELALHAARGGMTELTARAALHESRLGNPAALVAARALAAGIENPGLERLLRAG